jgi:hypothetical protein
MKFHTPCATAVGASTIATARLLLAPDNELGKDRGNEPNNELQIALVLRNALQSVRRRFPYWQCAAAGEY